MFGTDPNNGSPIGDQLYISPVVPAQEEEWNAAETEGELAVDVLETESDLIVLAPMAGTKSEDIFLHLHNDVLTIRARRSPPLSESAKYFFEECYWGKFSRTIVLPVEVKGDFATSEYKNGVLSIKIPKATKRESIPILVVEDV